MNLLKKSIQGCTDYFGRLPVWWWVRSRRKWSRDSVMSVDHTGGLGDMTIVIEAAEYVPSVVL